MKEFFIEVKICVGETTTHNYTKTQLKQREQNGRYDFAVVQLLFIIVTLNNYFQKTNRVYNSQNSFT